MLKDNLGFNPLSHELSPKYEILSEEERISLLKTYRIKPSNLPKILDSDPAVKALGAKPGDIIKIIRKSDLAGESVYYRLVISE
ncbi:MAG: DNA-directed RNA polymerase subunit H [Thermoproteota archaeon]|nr:DNA-directed RNA polymerase subunit H [Candidatus Brockarchaeota archaeon]MBO3767735.1 DNA-directed RNA polymerase subunit H [Candidatus Brockarchaeota archaeon]MBO3801443.1 DNA-directed RNA polymerase subunit H [Candidatus Brockarchaeota archaeon]